MTLEEAIKHYEQKAYGNSYRAKEHKQLAEWLKELQALRRYNSNTEKIEERAKEVGILSQYKSDYPYDKKSVEFGYMTGATEQKAIDEKVRLKKCDDITKTEYEREVAFADWYNKNGKGTLTYSNAIEWARKEVIDDACKWFGDYLFDIGYPDDWMRDSPNLKSGEERFRKAMEK